MFVPYHPARYAASRPWAKRVAHLFEHGGNSATADCEALLRRSLQAAPGGVGHDAARQEVECLLAQAYGHFVRHGRQVLVTDAVLSAALAATRPPKHLPVMSGLPTAACFFVVLPAGGAFVRGDAAGQQWQVLLLAAEFASGGVAWWQRSDEVLALTLRPGDALAVPDVAAVAPWREALYCLFNRLALLTQPRCQLTAAPPPALQALRRGDLPVQQLGWPQLALGTTKIARQGYWRRQAGNAGERLVWVPPAGVQGA